MERVSVEIWQQILLNVMETNDWPIFATSCTPYTFLAFMYLHVFYQRKQKPYQDYLTQRRRLRLVCRAWNEFVLFTSHRWLPLEEDSSPMYKLDPTTSYAKGGIGPVEKLTTIINSNEVVTTPILSWVSHILKRPASQTPLRTYILFIRGVLRPGYNPFDDLIGTTTTQDPGCSNTNSDTNTTLRALSIVMLSHSRNFISLSQICRTFTGLRMLFLIAVNTTPQQTLTLAHLEVLYVRFPSEALLESMGTWDVPALRHVSLEHFSMSLTGMLDRFLGRWAHQIESLWLDELDPAHYSLLVSPLHDLPSGFWAQFAMLRLLGLDCKTLECKKWSGWSVMPPPTHPCQYLVCPIFPVEGSKVEHHVGRQVEDIRARWTWHDGVRLVVGHVPKGQYFVVKNIQDGTSFANMEKTVGILPEL